MSRILNKIADYFGIIVGLIALIFAAIFWFLNGKEHKAQLENAENKARLDHEKIKDNGNIAVADDTASMLDKND